MESVTVTIINWDKYQKKVEKTPYWFAIKIGISKSRSLFRLTPEQKWAFLCLLEEAGNEKSATITVDLEILSHETRVPIRTFVEVIDSLKETGTLRVDSESTPSGLRADSENTPSYNDNDKDKDNKQKDLVCDFAKKPEIGTQLVPQVEASRDSAKASRRDVALGKSTQEAIAHWVREFRKRHEADPPIGGKQAGLVKTMVRDHGLERTKQLMQAYLQLTDKRICDECHPLEWLVLKLPRISVALQRGVESPSESDFSKKLSELIERDARSLKNA